MRSVRRMQILGLTLGHTQLSFDFGLWNSIAVSTMVLFPQIFSLLSWTYLGCRNCIYYFVLLWYSVMKLCSCWRSLLLYGMGFSRVMVQRIEDLISQVWGTLAFPLFLFSMTFNGRTPPNMVLSLNLFWLLRWRYSSSKHGQLVGGFPGKLWKECMT